MNRQNADVITIGTFLVGLGFLFLVNWFWPGVLLLIGITGFANQVAKGDPLSGFRALILFGALTIAFSLGLEWEIVLPIALIAVGMIGLFRALGRVGRR